MIRFANLVIHAKKKRVFSVVTFKINFLFTIKRHTQAMTSTATFEQAPLIDLITIYNGLSGEETEYCNWLNNKERLFNEVKELVKEYGYTGPNNYTAIYWFYQGIETERKRNKADMSVGYEHSYYPSRTKETILAKLKNFYKDFIQHHPNILNIKTIHITI